MINYAEEDRIDVAESSLLALIKKKHFPAIKFFLETKGRHRGYSTKIEVTHIDDSNEILQALARKYVIDG